MSFTGGGFGRTMTWQEELATLVSGEEPPAPSADAIGDRSGVGDGIGDVGEIFRVAEDESLKDQVKGFAFATCEMMRELGRGCWDIVEQSFEGFEETYWGKTVRRQWDSVSRRLVFLNDYLPEDRDPAQAWPVVIAVFFVALLVLTVSSGQDAVVQLPKKLYISPPSASRIQLPDGRNMSYLEQGVPAEQARLTMIAPHSFLSSRLAGIPGIKTSLLEEFGVRLVTYDLPGFGESDPHSGRDLNSSASDMAHLADSLEIRDKFWVVGYSAGSLHAWAAVRYIPDRLAGVTMFAPMVNPYDVSMSKEESRKTWEKWTAKRKLLYMLARRFPSLLPYFYRRSFLSGKQGRPEDWLSLSSGKKDKSLLEDPVFSKFWEKDVAESVRQGNSKPFVEEAVMQVSNWGFSLADLQVQKHYEGKGILQWLKSLFSQTEREWSGFLGPIHIWQGTDDRVVPPSMTEFTRRIVPGATVHRLLGEGHFSYFCFCDDCHRQIFSTLFGVPLGPLSSAFEEEQTQMEERPQELLEEIIAHNSTAQE